MVFSPIDFQITIPLGLALLNPKYDLFQSTWVSVEQTSMDESKFIPTF